MKPQDQTLISATMATSIAARLAQARINQWLSRLRVAQAMNDIEGVSIIEAIIRKEPRFFERLR